MTTQPPQWTKPSVRVGMHVVGADGAEVGTVKEVRDNDFRLNRPMKRDVYVPYSAVRDVAADTVMLNVPSDQVDNWPKPPVT